MEQIAEESDVARKTLYNHFPVKEAIVDEYVRDISRGLAQEAQEILQNLPDTRSRLLAAGKASGTARLINHPGEGNRLQPGDVLVAPSADPGWTPLFLKAGAVVMETGGFLSHGAIVAREYGVPAVVNVPGVMRVIQDGRKVVVDGDEGKIFLQ